MKVNVKVAKALLLVITLSLALALGLSACGPAGSSGDAQQIQQVQAEQVQYGIKYLRGTLAATIEAAEAAKLKNPENAAYIDSQFKPVIAELAAAVDAYDSALANEREDRWAWARALVTTVVQTGIRVGVPLLIESAAHR